MAEPHVISALRAKRAEISGHIRDQEKRLALLQATLVNVDKTILLFSPGFDLEAIAPKSPRRHSAAFARNELPRLILDALRDATGPVSSVEITAAIKRQKGLGDDGTVQGRVSAVLWSLGKRGIAERAGDGAQMRWALKP